MLRKYTGLALLILSICGCGNQKKERTVPVVGFIDYVQDETLEKAKQGFFDALKEAGYSEEQKTIEVIYRNAQGDQPTLVQSCDYLVSEKADLIAANTTLATITAIQKTKDIPVCMMVAPRPDIGKMTDANGNAPANLFGAYETLAYIDTSVAVIKELLPQAKKIGTIYNQAEPQSVDAQNRLKELCVKLGLELVALPVNNSSETQLVTQALLNKKPDVFFALPDNVIFASFEVISKACEAAHTPIFTSEAGLVKRGALAAYGADLYQWGHQSGEQAAQYLKTKSMKDLKPVEVKVRKRVFNPIVAKRYNINPSNRFEALN